MTQALHIIPASLSDYPRIQNMARFYVYEMSRYCGSLEGWEMPEDGLWECIDFKHYFTLPENKAFLVRVNHELAGFVLLDHLGTLPETEWNMGQFFITAKFQKKNIGLQVAEQIFSRHPGRWEVAVIPENTGALTFWRKTISHFTKGHYTEELRLKSFPDHDAETRYILSFQSNYQSKKLGLS